MTKATLPPDLTDAFAELRNVVKTLIGPGGCPWDRKQTPASLCDYVVEEAFELVEGIRNNDKAEAMEELGDVMFLLFFIAELYEEKVDFTLTDSINYGVAKMIRRHPHVWGDLEVENQEQLLKNWEQIKRGEKQEDGEKSRVFDSLPKGLPPLLRAYRINSKAARTGFTWETDADLEKQLDSEWTELKEAEDSGDKARMEEEFGDYLFTLAEYGRRKGLKANAALDFANRKFLERFNAMESLAREQGNDIASLTLDEQNALWNQVKAEK